MARFGRRIGLLFVWHTNKIVKPDRGGGHGALTQSAAPCSLVPQRLPGFFANRMSICGGLVRRLD
jgi:hypothetical protein